MYTCCHYFHILLIQIREFIPVNVRSSDTLFTKSKIIINNVSLRPTWKVAATHVRVATHSLRTPELYGTYNIVLGHALWINQA
jgi:hypothetical protein